MCIADCIRPVMVRCGRILAAFSAQRKGTMAPRRQWIGILATCAIPLTVFVLTAFAQERIGIPASGSVDALAKLPVTAGIRSDPPSAGAAYLGSKQCRMCHLQWHDSWQERPHARAWDALKPGNSRQAKRKANLAPNQDYTTDARCLACHVVGFGRPGGYTIPVSDDGKTRRAALVRRAVGCESCHGPGGGFVRAMKRIDKNMRLYDPKDLHDAGLNVMSPDICTTCHNASALCVEPGYEFDPATMAGDSFHTHFKLQYRREARWVRSDHRNKTVQSAPIPGQ